MPAPLTLILTASPGQVERLHALQQGFAQVCNALAPVARDSRCWNRVALHHMMYRKLREQFPQMGSQMVCNAIYSVSRSCRWVYQSAASPFNITRLGERPLPLLRFSSNAPVYFDRHTLSFKAGHVSMFTLDGRMRFEMGLSPADEHRFHVEKLQELVLTSSQDIFKLRFSFSSDTVAPDESVADLPEYLLVLPATIPTPSTGVPA